MKKRFKRVVEPNKYKVTFFLPFGIVVLALGIFLVHLEHTFGSGNTFIIFFGLFMIVLDSIINFCDEEVYYEEIK